MVAGSTQIELSVSLDSRLDMTKLWNWATFLCMIPPWILRFRSARLHTKALRV